MTGRVPRLVVAVGIFLVVAGRAGAQVEDPPTATIALAERSPWVSDARPLTLDITTTGDTAGTTLRVRIHPPLADADDLEASLTEDVGGITRSVDLGPTDEIPVSSSGTRRIVLTSEEIRSPGVHPVVVELRSAEGGVVDLVRTPVVRLGTESDPLAAPQLSLIVDVAIDPTVGPDGRREPSATEIGRLGRLATFLGALDDEDAASPRTVLVVPDTLDALAASSNEEAAAVLAQLVTAAATDPRAMPYVPVSAAALDSADLGEVVDTALSRGTLSLTDRFGRRPDPSLWWDDDVTPDAAARLADLGVDTILTGHGDGEADEEDPTTAAERLLVPAGPRLVPALADVGLTALVVDESTSDDLIARIDDRVDAVAVAIADLILRDAGRGSTIAVRVNDVPDESLLLAMLPLVTEDDSPISLAPTPAEREARDPDEDDLPDPVTLRTGTSDDLRPLADRYREIEREIATFDAFVGAESSRAVDLAVQQLTSVAGDLEMAERVALLDAVEAVVRNGFGNVELTGQTDLNLTSRRGELPVSIANANDFPVRVMVRIRSDRLRFPDGEEFEVTAQPDITRLDIPVEALATGSVPTFVEIRTPDGSRLLDDRQLNVRSTAVSGVGLALSVGALAVLAIWWVRTWRRSRVAGESSTAGSA